MDGCSKRWGERRMSGGYVVDEILSRSYGTTSFLLSLFFSSFLF